METVQVNEKISCIQQTIGALYSEISPGELIVRGTGILISPDLVLTAARTVFNLGTKVYYPALRFYPGQNGPL